MTVYLVDKTDVFDNINAQQSRKLMCLISLQALTALPYSCEMKYKEKLPNLPIANYTSQFVDYLGDREKYQIWSIESNEIGGKFFENFQQYTELKKYRDFTSRVWIILRQTWSCEWHDFLWGFRRVEWQMQG